MVKPFKIVILGDSQVGKTTLLYRLISESVSNIKPSINATFANKAYPYNNKNLNINFWDISENNEVNKLYLKDVDICILVYDMSNIDTYINIDIWKHFCEQISNPYFILIGNKSDLNSENINHKHIKNWCDINNIYYHQTLSAKNNIGTETLLHHLLLIIYRRICCNDIIHHTRRCIIF